jgi:hypothetical protein
MIKRVRQFISDWTEDLEPSISIAEDEVAFCVVLGGLEVGCLRLNDDAWVFNYTEEFRQQDKIKAIVDFPNKENEYRSVELWPFFLLRIPSLKQPAVQEFLRSANVESPTAAILLKQFGKRSIANPFELVPA